MKFFLSVFIFLFVKVNSQSVYLINTTNAKCSGTCDGTVTFSINGQAPPFSVIITNTNSCINPTIIPFYTTTLTINGFCACLGQYNFQFYDGNSIPIGSINSVINEPPPLNAVITKTNLCCPNTQSGAMNSNVSGGTPPYSYTWNPVYLITPYINNLQYGNYGVTISDYNGCVIYKNSNIGTPQQLLFYSNKIAPTCSTCCDGQISVWGFLGTMPYTYNINGGTFSTTSTFSNICNGTYTLCVKDGGCCSTCIVLSTYNATIINLTENNNTNEIEIFPNPVTEVLKIKYNNLDFFEGVLKFEIINGLGVTIKTAEANFNHKQATINIEDVPNGVYLFHFHIEKSNINSLITKTPILVSKRVLIAK